MTTTTLPNIQLPDTQEKEIAQKSYRDLSALLATKFEARHFTIKNDEKEGQSIEVPSSAVKLLVEILGELACGNAVQIVPVHAELTTQEAANILNVSRPHVVKLLEDGQIKFHKTGRHRRIRFADLMAFKQKRDADAMLAMDELTSLSQDYGIY
ncbi:helix-turn-helix domain-containing protein [Xenorhabdus doucetiae]|uniref:Excisionase family DNA binding protein n=1 Tax=Xenorhabdus doucetiae TaxID=351671 RepID=A0A068QSM1_9GAMM|nr:helix-turn-helix domain-containing protein [Xenorhabdus doucetiae]TYP15943.1 excisionase family DNA binding protein [Xenorhabdus doucetiae]CDG18027.1 putative Similarities with excisionase [Xenorhabdus doucetiae]